MEMYEFDLLTFETEKEFATKMAYVHKGTKKRSALI